MVPRVEAIIAGAQKAGTTALHEFLTAHPGISGVSWKEIHFFDHDGSFLVGTPPYEAYHLKFGDAPPENVWLDATPSYLYWRPCADRIAAYNPRIRLIVMLRNPVDRAYSHWQMEHARGNEKEAFEKAIAAEMAVRRANPAFQDPVQSYLARGEYATQLARFDALFPQEQIALIRYEEFRENPRRVLERLCAFLAVEPLERWPRFREVLPNVPRREAQPMNKATARELQHYFAPHNAALEARTGWDLEGWKDLL